jgi:hypothetical protein
VKRIFNFNFNTLSWPRFDLSVSNVILKGGGECDGIFTLCIHFPKFSRSEKLVTDFLKAPVRCVLSYDVCTTPKFRITVLCVGTSCSFEEPLFSEETVVSIFI